ncbi:uncharacterized protein [Typha angustifolia]|uniref:uncharacterized protein n=1 Tax=Typha angustifolia TaxID=59011 RepID=UPI003C2B298A
MGDEDLHRGVDLLQQLERLLDHDNLIDELGFVHPSQFAALDEEVVLDAQKSSGEMSIRSISGSDVLDYDRGAFWYNNHKLAISIQVLAQLYRAALRAYLDARRRYKECMDSSGSVDAVDDAIECIEKELLRHSKALLIQNYDFLSAWNTRKQILSRKHELSAFMVELQLSALILSYSPKSECAWSHRRWVIKIVAKKFQELHEIVNGESELVKKIAEKSKMNYRAWNHCWWLIPYMTRTQVLDELDKSRKWAESSVADNCCFHYRRRLLLRMVNTDASFSNYSDVCSLWKEEFKWNEILILRYMGREALWVHRRFLSQFWIKHFVAVKQELSPHLEDSHHNGPALDAFLAEEMQLLRTCLSLKADEFEDTRIQSQHAASYILWIWKQAPLLVKSKLQERICEMGDLKTMLVKTCPEKFSLWESLLA